VQQSRIVRRVIRETGSDDLTRLEIGNLHSPKVHDVVHDVVARTVHGVRAEDSGIRADARDGVALRVNQIKIIAATVGGFRLLENRPGQRIERVVRSIREMYFPSDLTGIGIHDVDVVGRAALPGWNIEQLSVRINCQPIDAGTNRFIPQYLSS